MSTQKKSYKMQNKTYFCKLCEYVANSEEELENHYKLSHEEDSDISTELELMFENKKLNQKKTETLRGKAIKQLKLLVEGKSYHNEYIGTCLQKYYIGRIGNTITLLPYATLC